MTRDRKHWRKMSEYYRKNYNAYHEKTFSMDTSSFLAPLVQRLPAEAFGVQGVWLFNVRFLTMQAEFHTKWLRKWPKPNTKSSTEGEFGKKTTWTEILKKRSSSWRMAKQGKKWTCQMKTSSFWLKRTNPRRFTPLNQHVLCSHSMINAVCFRRLMIWCLADI